MHGLKRAKRCLAATRRLAGMPEGLRSDSTGQNASIVDTLKGVL